MGLDKGEMAGRKEATVVQRFYSSGFVAEVQKKSKRVEGLLFQVMGKAGSRQVEDDGM